jgi:hypothetical protein
LHEFFKNKIIVLDLQVRDRVVVLAGHERSLYDALQTLSRSKFESFAAAGQVCALRNTPIFSERFFAARDVQGFGFT